MNRIIQVALLCAILIVAKLSQSFGQCAAGQPAKDRYCNNQYINFQVTPAANERYFWPGLGVYTNQYISPSTYPFINTGNYVNDSISMLVDVPYVKEITPAPGPVRPANATITSAASAMSTTAFDLDITSTSAYKINYLTLAFQSFYVNPGKTYTLQLSVAPGPVNADPITFTSDDALAGRIGTTNHYLVRVPVRSSGNIGLSLAGGISHTLNFSLSATGGSDLQYSWFDQASPFLPNTTVLSAGGNSFTTNYGTSVQNISGLKKPGIFDVDVTFVCPTQFAHAEFEFDVSKCCYGNKKPVTPNLVNSAGYTFINNGGMRTIIFDAPFSQSLTASLISDTSFFQWYKDGVELVAAGGAGQEVLTGVNSEGYYTVKAATTAQFINDINCVVYDTIWVQSRILNATKPQDTICFGKGMNVQVTGAVGNIQWTPSGLFNNPASSNPQFFPTNIQTYTVKVSADISIGNRVVNGSFTTGTVAPATVSTYYNSSNDLSQAGRYFVMNSSTALSSSPEIARCADHTTGNGNYLAVNASGSTDAANLKFVWAQTFTVNANTPYEFSAWLANINTNTSYPQASIQYYINAGAGDIPMFPATQTLAGNACAWQQLKRAWNSGSYAGNVTVKIASTSSNIYNGADFGIDDITFGVPSKQEDTLIIKSSNCLKLTTSSVCLGGDLVKFIAQVEGGSFGEWANTSATQNSTIYTPKLDTTTVKIVNGELSYTASAFVKLSNIITNSAFSDGVSGFNSDYNLVAGNVMPGQYTVSNNPNGLNTYFANIGDHTTGSGNMLVVDRSTPAADRMWYQTNISVQAGQTYDFSLWFAHLNIGYSKATPALETAKVLCCNCPNGTGPSSVNSVNVDTCQSPRAYMEIVIDGQVEVFTAPYDNLWHEFRSTYVASATKNITIAFKNHNVGGGGGRDFAIDDVTFAPRSNVTITETVPIACPLPVEFIDVRVTDFSQHREVSWKIANPSNIDFFEVEVSNDAKKFATLARVPFESGKFSYQFPTTLPSGEFYYRIKEVDLSNQTSYSPAVKALHSNSLLGIVYPNPSAGVITIETFSELLAIRVLTISGQCVREFAGESAGAAYEMSLPKGMYFVEFSDIQGISIQKVCIE
ncbi:MAG: T9SS type A sorting domain-containing protein [Cytophagaceae bacterium]|jgi:hypothetical protein|nr:T9SS type A sorting domain-containing protein [Cytophagaceae bacterium]